jgi:hypothetical protein
LHFFVNVLRARGEESMGDIYKTKNVCVRLTIRKHEHIGIYQFGKGR